MTDSNAFAKLVPGFDFLQGLVKNAGAALPGIGQWVAPTIDPAELEKRIGELRTVQFWLEQNARMLGATIQALEVQRMTLSTLKTMNVQMEGLRDSLQIRTPTPVPAPAPAPEVVDSADAPAADEATPAPGAVDPMKWWGALTQQFTELATQAMQPGVTEATRAMGGATGPGAAPASASASADVPAGKAKPRVAARKTAAAKKTPRSTPRR
jgi:hypothetical protein